MNSFICASRPSVTRTFPRPLICGYRLVDMGPVISTSLLTTPCLPPKSLPRASAISPSDPSRHENAIENDAESGSANGTCSFARPAYRPPSLPRKDMSSKKIVSPRYLYENETSSTGDSKNTPRLNDTVPWRLFPDCCARSVINVPDTDISGGVSHETQSSVPSLRQSAIERRSASAMPDFVSNSSCTLPFVATTSSLPSSARPFGSSAESGPIVVTQLRLVPRVQTARESSPSTRRIGTPL